MKPMRLIAEFLGYSGTNSSLRVAELIDLELVKPKLADGMWLGERCVDTEQLQGFRQDLTAIYEELASLKTAKKILRTNNTQVNEALHGIQSRLYRKDMHHGNSIEYVFAMAAGILKLSLGECYLPTLAARLGCKLPAAAHLYLDHKYRCLNQKAQYKSSVGGKRKRAKARINLKKKIQPGTVVEEVSAGYYVRRGKGLVCYE